MSKAESLALAREAVREAQKWVDAAQEEITYPGEMDDALDAYHEAASYFFELYDEVSS